MTRRRQQPPPPSPPEWDGTERRIEFVPIPHHTPHTSLNLKTVNDFLPLILAFGAVIGVWVNLNESITTLKLRNGLLEEQIKTLSNDIKDMNSIIAKSNEEIIRSKEHMNNSIRDLEGTITQMYQSIERKQRSK